MRIIPYEDRKGEWMVMASDRYRFMKRIRDVSTVIKYVLTKHLEDLSRTPQTVNLQAKNDTWVRLRSPYPWVRLRSTNPCDNLQ